MNRIKSKNMVRNNMRNFVLFLLLSLTLSVFAQSHLKMFGIPLTGNIESFTSKMQSKGLSVDKEKNKVLPSGVRAFKGSFAGYVASQIHIFYDPRTKIVFKGLVNFNNLGDRELFRMYNDLKERISEKQASSYCRENQNDDGLPFSDIFVYNTSTEEDEPMKGWIKIGIMALKIYPFSKSLYVSYEDEINSKRFNESRSDDL